MSASFRRRDISPQSRSGKLRMDRQPVVARITDPSLAAGKRKEIDNVMKKARATSTNVYWDKKLLEAEEKDPNRWRHTGYKKMYIEGDSSSESEREGNFRYNNNRNGGGGGNGGPGIGMNNGGGGGGYRGNINGPSGGRPPGGGGGGPPIGSRSRSRSPARNFISRKTPPLSPPIRRRTPDHIRRGMMDSRGRMPRSPDMIGRGGGLRTGSPMHIQRGGGGMRRGRGGAVNMGIKSPIDSRRRSPMGMPPNKRAPILPRSKRPPSPPPKTRPPCRSRSNSSVSSCSDDSCSVCSPKHHGQRSHSSSISRSRPGGPRSPPPKINHHGNRGGPPVQRVSHHHHQSGKRAVPNSIPTTSRRPASPPPVRVEKYRGEDKVSRSNRETSRDLLIERPPPEPVVKSRSSRHSSPPADPRLKIRPPEPPEPAPVPKKKKDNSGDKVKKIRRKIKIEGEKQQRKKQHNNNSSTDSDDSESDSEGSLPTFTATTRLTLSERFGKMAQWSVDRSNMENMRITKDSTGGALKVMIEEGMESPPQRFSYSPAPAGHFPEELATTAPTGMLSWDDVRVRFEYYKSRGYLRDLDLKDYIKWEEWWYRYQEWLKQERYYEFWERQQMHRRRRKKIPIAQRLN